MRSGPEIFRKAMRADAAHRVPLLEEIVSSPDVIWDGLPGLADAWEELAECYGAVGEHELAIRAIANAIEAGWSGVPDPRVKLAEYHLAAGRVVSGCELLEAAREDRGAEVWLYAAAGLMLADNELHVDAVAWLGKGIELALAATDPDSLLVQLVELRAESLFQLSAKPDELQLRAVDRLNADDSSAAADEPLAWPPPAPSGPAVALAFFPGGELAQAMARWPDLDEPSYEAYVWRIEGTAKLLETTGVRIAGLSPIRVNRYVAWCTQGGYDPADRRSRAEYAMLLAASGQTIAWPPRLLDDCWCGSGRTYRRCCDPAPPVTSAE
jgi:hypothetical protein